MSSPAALRLFFALWPDDGQREAISSLIQAWVSSPVGRAVPPGNLHVTLAFLGKVAPEQIPSLREVAAARTWPDEALVFDRLAGWPKARLLCLEARALPPDFAAAVQMFQ